MNKKILILLVVAVSGLTALTNWSELSYRAFISAADGEVDVITGATQNAEEQVGTSLKSGLNWKQELSHDLNENLSVNLENNLFWSEKSQEYRNSYLYNFGKLNIKYIKGSHYLKVQYSNRFYEHKETRLLNIAGVDYRTQQQMVHNSSLQYRVKWNKIDLEIFAAMRNLDFVYYQKDPESDKFRDDDEEDDEDDIERYSSWENDLYTTGKLTFEIHENWKAYTTVYYKNDLNEESWFNETRSAVGLQYFNRLDFFNILKADISYFYEDSEKLTVDQKNNFLTSVRYTKRIGSALAGFISFQNRTCYDTNENKLLRISNLIRFRAKYSFQEDKLKDSYLQFGLKYNPENNGSLISTEWNQNIYKNSYAVLMTKYAPEQFSKIGAKFEYFLNSDKSFWIQDEYTDYNDWPAQHLISVGTTLIF